LPACPYEPANPAEKPRPACSYETSREWNTLKKTIMNFIFIAPRKYVQGRNVLRESGVHIGQVGKKPLMLWDSRLHFYGQRCRGKQCSTTQGLML
jgi:hypothetical protein